jgi:hypothetical protein
VFGIIGFSFLFVCILNYTFFGLGGGLEEIAGSGCANGFGGASVSIRCFLYTNMYGLFY